MAIDLVAVQIRRLEMRVEKLEQANPFAIDPPTTKRAMESAHTAVRRNVDIVGTLANTIENNKRPNFLSAPKMVPFSDFVVYLAKKLLKKRKDVMSTTIDATRLSGGRLPIIYYASVHAMTQKGFGKVRPVTVESMMVTYLGLIVDKPEFWEELDKCREYCKEYASEFAKARHRWESINKKDLASPEVPTSGV